MQIPDVNLDAITDPAARQVIGHLLNLIETLSAENQARRAENQHLRDENARLKSGSAKPDLKPPTPPAPSTDHSSEQERHSPKPRQKGRKIGILVPTRTERCVVDPAILPPDAIRHATTEVIVQDLLLQPEIIRFVREGFVSEGCNGQHRSFAGLDLLDVAHVLFIHGIARRDKDARKFRRD